MQKLQHFSQVSPQTIHVVYLPWVQGPLWQCSGVSDMQIYKYKYKDKYTWAPIHFGSSAFNVHGGIPQLNTVEYVGWPQYTWAQYTLVRVPLTFIGGTLN